MPMLMAEARRVRDQAVREGCLVKVSRRVADPARLQIERDWRDGNVAGSLPEALPRPNLEGATIP
jgi:hypothetical protein